MRKVILLLIVALLLLVVVVPASANASQVCTQNSNFGLSHGACVSYNTAGVVPAADAVSWCKLNNNFFHPNLGQCVKSLQNGG